MLYSTYEQKNANDNPTPSRIFNQHHARRLTHNFYNPSDGDRWKNGIRYLDENKMTKEEFIELFGEDPVDVIGQDWENDIDYEPEATEASRVGYDDGKTDYFLEPKSK